MYLVLVVERLTSLRLSATRYRVYPEDKASKFESNLGDDLEATDLLFPINLIEYSAIKEEVDKMLSSSSIRSVSMTTDNAGVSRFDLRIVVIMSGIIIVCASWKRTPQKPSTTLGSRCKAKLFKS